MSCENGLNVPNVLGVPIVCATAFLGRGLRAINPFPFQRATRSRLGAASKLRRLIIGSVFGSKVGQAFLQIKPASHDRLQGRRRLHHAVSRLPFQDSLAPVPS
jgi:hypothetical protein